MRCRFDLTQGHEAYKGNDRDGGSVAPAYENKMFWKSSNIEQRTANIEYRIKKGVDMKTGKRGNRGFTLIELLIVMIILGLLAALVGPRMFGKVGKSKQKAAKAQIGLLETALDTYRLDVGKYPTNEQGLQALREKPGDVEGLLASINRLCDDHVLRRKLAARARQGVLQFDHVHSAERTLAFFRDCLAPHQPPRNSH